MTGIRNIITTLIHNHILSNVTVRSHIWCPDYQMTNRTHLHCIWIRAVHPWSA